MKFIWSGASTFDSLMSFVFGFMLAALVFSLARVVMERRRG